MNTINKTLLAGFIAASLGLSGAALANDTQAPERTAGQAIDDATITASVKAKLLEDDRTDGFDINVDTMNGRVTLRGGADTSADKAAAGEIARGTDGVVSVDNQLTVAAPDTPARDAANQATASGEVRQAASETGEVITDAWITSKVKAQLLADGDVSGLEISVETTDKVVRLTGDTPSAAVRAEAIRIAESTEGVARVDASGLTVAGGKGDAR